LIFAILVSDGITPPVRRLLEGTRAVEAGRLDGSHRGIIDKYIGDAIMAYWGPPFIDETDQARFACFAAIDMIGRIATLRLNFSAFVPSIATGEALGGSIGSEFMMSYTVMGDTVNLASPGRLQLDQGGGGRGRTQILVDRSLTGGP
jgi:class 3 adenylate cyclase